MPIAQCDWAIKYSLQDVVLVGSLATYQVRDERAHRSFNHFSKQPVGKNRSVCTANKLPTFKYGHYKHGSMG